MSIIINPYIFGAGADPLLNVSALLHFEDATGATTPTDETGKTWTRLGGAVIVNTQAVFGTRSLANSTGTSQGIRSPNDSDFAFGTGDFCAEFRYRPNSLTGGLILIDSRTSAADANGWAIYTSGSSLRFFTNNADRITGPNLALNTWYAIALTRVSGTTRLFVDGTQQGSSYTDSANYTRDQFSVGYQLFNGAGSSGGFYDELRISKGDGRYSGNYTVATAAFAPP